MTYPAAYDAEEDSEYLFNQLRPLEHDERVAFVENELASLESNQAAMTQSPVDLVYMRKVWLTVLKRVEADKKPKIEVPKRNVRYSKKFQ